MFSNSMSQVQEIVFQFRTFFRSYRKLRYVYIFDKDVKKEEFESKISLRLYTLF